MIHDHYECWRHLVLQSDLMVISDYPNTGPSPALSHMLCMFDEPMEVLTSPNPFDPNGLVRSARVFCAVWNPLMWPTGSHLRDIPYAEYLA
jgi:hypothetical protein